MLVNTIAFYPRPLRVIEPSALVNVNAFGAPVMDVDTVLALSTVENTQSFGGQSLLVTRRYLQPAALINGQSFGDNQVTIRNRTYLAAATVANTGTFGSHRFTKKVLAAAVANPNSFGSPVVAVAAKKYSYANTLGTGNRTGAIAVTTTATLGGGSIANLVDGDATANSTHSCWFSSGQSGREIKLDLGNARIIRQARWKQDSTATHGSWKWQGSNDNSAYTDIGGSFVLGGVAGAQIHTELIANTTAYRYYRLLQVSGTTSAGPWLEEIEFFIDGATDDIGDTSYRYPMGGGVDAGGTVSGSGGNGVDRASGSPSITVTGNYTVASSGSSPGNLVDGAAGNNTADSIDFQSNQTAISVKFDFGAGNRQRINAFTWEQSNSTGQGNYDLAGSNDDVSYTTLASNFSLVNGTSLRELTFTNAEAYRYYKLLQVSGNTASSPWIREIYFKCCPDTRGS